MLVLTRRLEAAANEEEVENEEEVKDEEEEEEKKVECHNGKQQLLEHSLLARQQQVGRDFDDVDEALRDCFVRRALT